MATWMHPDMSTSMSMRSFEPLGADPNDLVPFEKYAKAALGLLKPSSAARAIDAGAPMIERVDLLVQLISHATRHARRYHQQNGRHGRSSARGQSVSHGLTP